MSQLKIATGANDKPNPYPGWVTSELAIVKMWLVIGWILEPASQRLIVFIPINLHSNEGQIKDQTQVWLVKV